MSVGCQSVGSPIWSNLKYLHNYRLDLILYMHSWSPNDEPSNDVSTLQDGLLWEKVSMF